MTAATTDESPTKDVAAQPVAEGDGPLSPWWLRAMVIMMVLGFSGLLSITTLSYHNALPIPAQVVNEQGALVFNADDVGEGEAVVLRYGLMANGSVWGSGPTLTTTPRHDATKIPVCLRRLRLPVQATRPQRALRQVQIVHDIDRISPE